MNPNGTKYMQLLVRERATYAIVNYCLANFACPRCYELMPVASTSGQHELALAEIRKIHHYRALP